MSDTTENRCVFAEGMAVLDRDIIATFKEALQNDY